MKQRNIYRSISFQLWIILLLSGCGIPSKPGEQAESGDLKAYITIGDEIVSKTFSVLSGHLKAALEDGGVRSALQYCSVEALPLTDSLAREYGVSIRRVSDKYRNLENKPNETERDIIELFKTQIKEKQVIAPVIRKIDNKNIAYFAPIIMQPLCLQCHGKVGETLKGDDYSYLLGLYPDDQAIGYQAGDLRGIWSIFDLQKIQPPTSNADQIM